MGSTLGPKSRGKSGYQHFLSEFSEPIPEGMKKREFKGAAWAKLTQEEKEEWNQKAAQVNEAAGIHKKPAPIKTSQEDNDKYEQLLMEWSSKDPETRGPMPSRPSSQKSSPASSQKSSPASSPPTSPKENSTENSNADDDSSDDEDLAEKLAKLQMKTTAIAIAITTIAMTMMPTNNELNGSNSSGPNKVGRKTPPPTSRPGLCLPIQTYLDQTKTTICLTHNLVISRKHTTTLQSQKMKLPLGLNSLQRTLLCKYIHSHAHTHTLNTHTHTKHAHTQKPPKKTKKNTFLFQN